MDPSQSPTQSNGDRSYDRYENFELPPSAELRNEEDGHESLPNTAQDLPDDDDTEVVKLNFDNITADADTTSPFGDRSSAIGLGSSARLRKASHNANPLVPHLPETPAPQQNPFRQSKSQLLAPSQLFGGTQFSSAIKLVSPTSSRPSPNDFGLNAISPNPPAVSSPLKDRGLRSTPAPNLTSSPQILPGTTPTRGEDGPSSPPHASSAKISVISDSQGSRPRRKKSGPEPMSEYEPMHKSQERRASSVAQSRGGSDDEGEDDALRRRRKVRSKKEAALNKLNSISFPRPAKSDDVDLPSSSNRRKKAQADAYIAQCHGSVVEEPRSEDAVIADSQEKPPKSAQPKAAPDQEPTQSTQSEAEENGGEENEWMPDTAPTLPVGRMSPPPALVEPEGPSDRISGDAIPETSPTRVRSSLRQEPPLPSSDQPLIKSRPVPALKSSPPAPSTRAARSRGARTSTSSLSNLEVTPAVSANTTPGSLMSVPKIQETTEVPESSPMPVKGKRGANRTLSKLKTASMDSLSVSSRRGRRFSNSTDELARSASATPTMGHSLRASRSTMSKSSRASSKLPQVPRGRKIFEGMAFAISFQSKKPGETNEQYNTRSEFALQVEKRIKQAGGKVLETGFDELFDAPPVKAVGEGPSNTPQGSPGMPEVRLNSMGRSMGFTALIADGHSRKVKYMQALALGLPCIATRWITSCLEKDEILDWTPYLLCAGQSTFLGDAIRSRSLIPYDATTARLENVINTRPMLLSDSKILVVMKKASETKKMAYVFLARVLGGSVARVYSIEEARAEAKSAEDAGKPFDWVYVDGKEEAGNLVTGAAGAPAGGKKRKRGSAAASMVDNGPPLKKIRTLSDELVIQTLILGRVIEEDEMEG